MKILSFVTLFSLAVHAVPGWLSRYGRHGKLKALALDDKNDKLQKLAFAHEDFVNSIKSPLFDAASYGASASMKEIHIYDAVVMIVENIYEIKTSLEESSELKNQLQQSILAYVQFANYYELLYYGNEKAMFLFKQATSSYNNVLESYLLFLEKLDSELFIYLQGVVEDVAALSSDSHKQARAEFVQNMRLIDKSQEDRLAGGEGRINKVYAILRNIVDLVYVAKSSRGSNIDEILKTLLKYRSEYEEALEFAKAMEPDQTDSSLFWVEYVSGHVMGFYKDFFSELDQKLDQSSLQD